MVNFTSPLHPYDSVPCERMLSESIKQPDERFLPLASSYNSLNCHISMMYAALEYFLPGQWQIWNSNEVQQVPEMN